MIFYLHQVVKLETYDKPAIFIGYDKTADNKLWVVRLNPDNKGFVDWFFEDRIKYVKVKINNPALPKGEQIFYGKFKINGINYVRGADPSKEKMASFEKYLLELQNKEK